MIRNKEISFEEFNTEKHIGDKRCRKILSNLFDNFAQIDRGVGITKQQGVSKL